MTKQTGAFESKYSRNREWRVTGETQEVQEEEEEVEAGVEDKRVG